MRGRDNQRAATAADTALDEAVRARADLGGYALVGPSARTWRTDPDTGRLLEPVSEAEHRTLRHLLGNETVTTTEPAWTDTPDGHDIVATVLPVDVLGLTGGEGPPIDAGPALTAEEAAHELAADGRSLDEARALVSGYLNDVSAQIGASAHLRGLDAADLDAIRAGERTRTTAEIQRAHDAVTALPATTEDATVHDDQTADDHTDADLAAGWTPSRSRKRQRATHWPSSRLTLIVPWCPSASGNGPWRQLRRGLLK